MGGTPVIRSDISEYLIHFTKGTSIEHAFQNLKDILRDGKIKGATHLIKGGYNCVCFSEAPLPSIPDGLVNPAYYSRYSPFGILVSKELVFSLGGRPVIYQPESEYDLLPQSHRWRHVTFNLVSSDKVDFTWEREWRLLVPHFDINPSNSKIIVPNKTWTQRIIDEYEIKQDHMQMKHEWEQDFTIRQYGLIMDENIAEQYREPFFRERFSWEIMNLEKH